MAWRMMPTLTKVTLDNELDKENPLDNELDKVTP